MVEAGDKVRIKNYAKKFNGELATVDSRDGAYVYVFPDCQPENKEYPLELYEHEVELVQKKHKRVIDLFHRLHNDGMSEELSEDITQYFLDKYPELREDT